MLVVVDVVLYLHSARISQRYRLTQLLVKQCHDYRLLQYNRATEKQTSAIREFVTGTDLVVLEKQTSAIKAFVTGRDTLVVLPTGSGKSLNINPLVGYFLTWSSITDWSGQTTTLLTTMEGEPVCVPKMSNA